jgi:inosose dehydratase
VIPEHVRMTAKINRRQLLGTVGLGIGSAFHSAAQPKRRLKIGHTGITWGFKPDDAPNAIRDAGSLGYMGYETFGELLEAWEPTGGLKRVLDENKLPLISAYCNVNLTDPTKRQDEIARAVLWAKLIKQAGGVTAVMGPNGVKRSSYDFKTTRNDIIAALNEICQAVSDTGITPALHQHTGTCIESRDEVYSVLEAVNTKYVKFGPDVGQLAKGGSDPVKVVSDFLPLIRHVHLKDWNALGGVLSAGSRKGKSAGRPGSVGEFAGHEDHHGGTRPEPRSSRNTAGNRHGQQGVSDQTGLYVPILTSRVRPHTYGQAKGILLSSLQCPKERPTPKSPKFSKARLT